MKHKIGNRFSMQAQGDSADILIYEEIGASFWGGGVDPKQFAQDLKGLGDVKVLNVRINSPGGDVFDGAAIYNQLVQHPATVNVYVDGLAASVASLIAMAGDTIYMAENAMMMIHNAWGCTAGDANDMRAFADVLQKVSDSMAGTYVKRSGLKASEIKNIMDAETWLSAQDCIDKGFADEMADPPDASAKAQFDLSHFKNVPKAMAKNQLVPSASAEWSEPPAIYHARLKLYERTLNRS
jgi:ATP-dependent protease ClpP protease subunit